MHLYNKNIKIRETLIEHPEFIIANDSKNRTPLHCAVELLGKSTNLTTIEILNFDNLLNIPAINYEGITPLHCAFDQKKEDQCLELLQSLINTSKNIKGKKFEVKFDLSLQSYQGKNALHYFAENHKPKKKSVNFKTTSQNKNRALQIFNFLIENSGNKEEKLHALRMVDCVGNTPLHSLLLNVEFCKICPTEIVKEFGSNIYRDGIIQNNQGFTALHCFVSLYDYKENKLNKDFNFFEHNVKYNWNFSFLDPLINNEILKVQSSNGNTIVSSNFFFFFFNQK